MENLAFNRFIFSPGYRIARHLLFWTVHVIVFTMIYSGTLWPAWKGPNEIWTTSAIWVIPFILYSYPLMYLFIPQFLLKEKYVQFLSILIIWAIFGWFLNFLFRQYILFPFRDHFYPTPTSLTTLTNKNPWAPASYLNMNLMAVAGSMIVLFKFWFNKQRLWMQAEKEKLTAELQLLKAQVHPHFLFNTLNTIYSFSLEQSPRTPVLVLKLSSLLRYILYDCQADFVSLEKEINIMKDYIDLEKERYANKLELSLNFEGDIGDNVIAPLILLPFLENAFKHGTSELLEKPWFSLDLSVKGRSLQFKMLNSFNKNIPLNQNGIGISNVRKRLEILYPGKHTLKTETESDFFIVSLSLELDRNVPVTNSSSATNAGKR